MRAGEQGAGGGDHDGGAGGGGGEDEGAVEGVAMRTKGSRWGGEEVGLL